MEINTEINKIFGQEMAKLFADSISEEELRAKAKDAWLAINKKESMGYYDSRRSQIETLVKEELLSRIKTEVNTILSTEEVKIDIHNRAQEIINNVRKKTEEKIIERTSNMIADLYCADTKFALKNYVEYGMNEAAMR